jgi:hypothetical protein
VRNIQIGTRSLTVANNYYLMAICDFTVCTVKGARGKVLFDSQTDEYASQLSRDASPEAYLSLRKLKSVFVILKLRCDKYASREA